MIVKEREIIETLPAEDLPADWIVDTIGSLIAKDGVFVDGDWVESKDQDTNGDVRLIQLADIGDGFYRNKSDRYLTYDKALKLGCTFLQKGDVLVARMPDPLGRACIFPGDSKKSVTVVDVCIIRPNKTDVNNRWLMYFINAPVFREAVASLQAGSTRKRISRSNLAKIQLPVPPAEEQKLIVAEIETQFSRLDEAVANLKRVKANLKRYKAAVLKAAVEGKLTEEWRKTHPDVEPASGLLKRVLTERRQKWEDAELAKMKAKGNKTKDDKWKEKYKEPSELDISDLPELPTGWSWISLETVTDAIGGYAFESKRFSGSGYQIVKMANVKMGKIDLSQQPSFISDVESEVVNKYSLIPGDILVTLTGTRKKRDYGYIAVVKDKTKILLNQRIVRLRPYGKILPKYIEIAMQNEVYRNRFFSYETGNVGQGNVGMSAVTKEPIALPPSEEQKVIVAEIDRHFSIAEEIEGSINASLARATSLRQTILKQVFSKGIRAKKVELDNIVSYDEK